MKLEPVFIIVGKKVAEARGHKRGSTVMVPSPHGPLYFNRPKWHDSRTAAEKFIKGNQ